MEGNVFLGTLAFKKCGSVTDDFVDVKFRKVQKYLFVIKVVKGEQIAGELVQTLCLRNHDF